MGLTRSIASWCLLGIFLMPSPRILDPDRTHKRHATCEHHLRRHHPDPAERARILRRAERRKRRDEERARLEEQRVRARRERLERAFEAVTVAQTTAAEQDDADAAAQVAEALDESNLQPCQAAADPQDDDSRMRKGKRAAKLKTLFWSLQEPQGSARRGVPGDAAGAHPDRSSALNGRVGRPDALRLRSLPLHPSPPRRHDSCRSCVPGRRGLKFKRGHDAGRLFP